MRPKSQLPLSGLVAVGGSLCRVTRSDPDDDASDAIFHVVVATGDVTIDHLFGATTLPRTPSSPLVLGADGLLASPLP